MDQTRKKEIAGREWTLAYCLHIFIQST